VLPARLVGFGCVHAWTALRKRTCCTAQMAAETGVANLGHRRSTAQNVRVTFAERQATLPAPSLARIVIVFVPTSRGIGGVFQVVVPVAVPEPPVELVHVTEVTPTLSDAVPEKTMVAEDATTLVLAGERMARVGGVVSLVGGADAQVITILPVAVPPLFA
jgi:hypothetical protein